MKIKKFIWLVLLLVLPAQALSKELSGLSNEELDKAKDLYAEAQVLYKSKDYDKALPLYQQAYDITGEPGLMKNIAQCHRFLGNADEAIKGYRLYLEKEPDSKYKDQIEGKIKELEEKLAVAKAKSLEAKTPPTPDSQPASIATTITESDYSLYATNNEINATFDDVESLIQKSEEELAKLKRRMRFIVPGSIRPSPLEAFGLGALLIESNIQLNNRVDRPTQISHITLAVASDLAFVAAGYTLYRALSKNKKESSLQVAIVPNLNGGGSVAVSVTPSLLYKTSPRLQW